MNNAFSIKESLSFGWNTLKGRAGFFIGAIAIVGIILITSGALLTPQHGGNALFTILNFIISVLVDMGLVAIMLAAHENAATAELKMLWAPHPFWKYLGASILVGIVVFIGFILLIVPGIIASLGLMFTKYLVMDRKLGPVEAMKESWRITKGNRLHLLGFVLTLVGLNILGVIALLVGLLVTIPLTLLATVHVYRALEHAAHEVAAPLSA